MHIMLLPPQKDGESIKYLLIKCLGHDLALFSFGHKPSEGECKEITQATGSGVCLFLYPTLEAHTGVVCYIDGKECTPLSPLCLFAVSFYFLEFRGLPLDSLSVKCGDEISSVFMDNDGMKIPKKPIYCQLKLTEMPLEIRNCTLRASVVESGRGYLVFEADEIDGVDKEAMRCAVGVAGDGVVGCIACDRRVRRAVSVALCESASDALLRAAACVYFLTEGQRTQAPGDVLLDGETVRYKRLGDGVFINASMKFSLQSYPHSNITDSFL